MVGQTISHYRIVEKLGSGGMGDVYLAEDVRLRRRVAVKVLAPRLVTDQERVRRFDQEARAVSALNHPNILTIYDIGQAGDVHFIATEFVAGETLRARLAGGRLSLGRCWRSPLKPAARSRRHTTLGSSTVTSSRRT